MAELGQCRRRRQVEYAAGLGIRHCCDQRAGLTPLKCITCKMITSEINNRHKGVVSFLTQQLGPHRKIAQSLICVSSIS